MTNTRALLDALLAGVHLPSDFTAGIMLLKMQ